MNIVDKVVEYLNPAAGLKRRAIRKVLSSPARSATYAAAKTNRMTGSWLAVNSNVNDIIGNSSPTVRARVRQLVRDFPYFSNAVNRIVTHTVGAGIFYQSKIQTPDGVLDKKRIREAEDAFKRWADEADVAKRLHYYEMMQLAKRQDVESGEFLIVKRHRSNENRYLPFCLQIYEADWLTTKYDTADMRITQGIESNPLTGMVTAYYFEDPDSYTGKTIKIPADQVIHGFQTLRPGQRRGISPFTPGVLLSHDLQTYMDATIDTAKLAAKWLAFVKTPAPGSRQLMLTEDTDTGQQIDDLENAIIEYLNPGEEVTFASNPNPGSNFEPFVRLTLTMLAATTGLPYEMLSGDYQKLNYSTSRTARNDFLAYLKPICNRHIRHFCKPTVYAFLDYAYQYGKLPWPGYHADPWHYQTAEWQTPGLESVDPAKETRAWVDGIQNHIRTPQEAIRARGRDPEEVIAELKQWYEMTADLPLPMGVAGVAESEGEEEEDADEKK